MNRGKGYQTIFNTEVEYYLFLETLEEAYTRFGVEIQAYCLMGNHYHLLIKTPYCNLSRAMRHINGVYTQRYNRLNKTDGPLFRGRFKSIIVESDSYLIHLSK
jgi:putative transposase